MAIDVKTVGQIDDRPVRAARLESTTGVRLDFLTYGSVLRDWQVPIHGERRSVVLGFNNYESYLKDTEHIGAIVGRVANRIAGAQFRIGSRVYKLSANVPPNHLHGGPKGIGRQNWELHTDEQSSAVIMTLKSPAGDMGYPGEVDFKVTYRLKDYRLHILMEATVNELTPINMVQHYYFNLMGRGSVLDHRVHIDSSSYTPLSEQLVPTGELAAVDNSFYDLRHARPQRTPHGEPQAYDINYVLNPDRDVRLDTVAIVKAPDDSLTLNLYSDQPGLQFYNGYYLDAKDDTLSGEPYGRHMGLCLEDQMFPDALNHPHFPSILVSPDKPYRHECEIEIK